jgi:hypothetical protein
MPKTNSLAKTALGQFAVSLTSAFKVSAAFNPEDQLKAPVKNLATALAKSQRRIAQVVTEVQVEGLGGRPDVGVALDGLLVGYIELKAPGKGADPRKFKSSSDKAQWEKFQDLPNLVYTDGNEWALYRSGERVGKLVRLSGDVIEDGAKAVDERDVQEIGALFKEFLGWEPVAPTTPRALANMLAPVCRLLRADVLEALQNPASTLSSLAEDWRRYLFPEADDPQFADAYAQTFTYALLLARLSGEQHLSIPAAARTLRSGHTLLADALKILGDDSARAEIRLPVDLLERLIAAVDASILDQIESDDPWLYFYEDFLAAYDPRMRNNRGVYFTPYQVVQAQVRLSAQLLQERFGKDFSFVDEGVTTLDPCCGTGTYLLAAIQHGLDQVARRRGAGMRKNAATQAGKNMFAFEILVGPYAVAHLRLAQQILAEGGALPEEGVQVYLTDTLESPNTPPPALPTLYKQLGEEYRRAQQVKASQAVLVCIGNPPYDRQQLDSSEVGVVRRKGGWIRYSDPQSGEKPKLDDFLAPLEGLGWGVHAKNLYNDYIYFWRWALWKVFEAKQQGGIVSFITASSYLRGPGFAGVRQVMRQTFDELWIIDLEGDNLGARKSENVFAIQTPVAITIGVRNGPPRPETPAAARYTRLQGGQAEKLATLEAVQRFDDLPWRECLGGWTDVFLPASGSLYWDWPLLTDIFPWQENGVQFKRTWPIAESKETLEARWQALLEMPLEKKRRAFRETGGRGVQRTVQALDADKTLPAIASLGPGTPPLNMARYAYRSFDRQWAILDPRLADRPRPTLQQAHSDRQVYLTSLLTNVLGDGPSVVSTALLPDLDHFRGSFGAKHVIPLWRDPQGSQANLTRGLLARLTETYAAPVAPEDLFAYTYALLFSPLYVRAFWEELTIPGPRLPITRDAALFCQAAELGKQLLWLHTYGQRFIPPNKLPGKLPTGRARCKVGTPSAPEEYPASFAYDPLTQELAVGGGVFEQVRPQVWEFSVSGLQVVKSWLGYRMKQRSGKKSSPLDDIRPERWSFDDELLDLLWVLDATVDLLPRVEGIFQAVIAGPTLSVADFPPPAENERRGLPRSGTLTLFDLEALEAGDSGDE